MKKIVLLLLFTGFVFPAKAQPAKDYAIPLRASVDQSAPAIRIHWQTDPNADGYVLHRKEAG